MLVEKISVFTVKSYKKLWKMYKDGLIGGCEQRLPDNLVKMKAGEDGSDLQLIEALLATDTDNFYHVLPYKNKYIITITGFGIEKTLDRQVGSLYIGFGEDGLWQNGTDVDGAEIDDTSYFGEIFLFGGEPDVTHERKNPDEV